VFSPIIEAEDIIGGGLIFPIIEAEDVDLGEGSCHILAQDERNKIGRETTNKLTTLFMKNPFLL
jgi:hypothetical protein